ncbi:MAG TPA: hypothetical protein PK122_05885 [Candidatus Paceibacterota bacterium]|nr:hypothetical protein [Candidatus Paceibacterota bacterium]
MDRKKWKSPQALIVIALVFLIFLYIGIDMAKVKPEIKRDLQEVKKEYTELSSFLDRKIPEIDSTLRIQATQISRQGEDIDSLNSKVSSLTSR